MPIDSHAAAQMLRYCLESSFRLAGDEVRLRMSKRALRKHLPPGWGSPVARPAQRAHALLAIAEDTVALAADADTDQRREQLTRLAEGDLQAARDALTEVGGGIAMRGESDRIRRHIGEALADADLHAVGRTIHTARTEAARLAVEGCAEDAALAGAAAADADPAMRAWVDWVRDERPTTEQALARLPAGEAPPPPPGAAPAPPP